MLVLGLRAGWSAGRDRTASLMVLLTYAVCGGVGLYAAANAWTSGRSPFESVVHLVALVLAVGLIGVIARRRPG
jgi:hypothetical protein